MGYTFFPDVCSAIRRFSPLEKTHTFSVRWKEFFFFFFHYRFGSSKFSKIRVGRLRKLRAFPSHDVGENSPISRSRVSDNKRYFVSSIFRAFFFYRKGLFHSFHMLPVIRCFFHKCDQSYSLNFKNFIYGLFEKYPVKEAARFKIVDHLLAPPVRKNNSKPFFLGEL